MHKFLKFIFGIKLHVSDSFFVHHQESSTVHTTGICHTGYADSLLAGCQHNLCNIYLLLCVQF